MDSQMTVCRDCGTSILSEARFCWSCGSPQGQATASTPRLTSRRGDDLLARLRDATAGEYEVRAEIGRGAMAAVFLGQDLSLNRPVAIKVMLSGSYFTDDMPDRFRLEARTAAKLDHPNIVKVYAVKEVDGLLLFVMNFVEGRALRSSTPARRWTSASFSSWSARWRAPSATRTRRAWCTAT
jgi:serine/threonine protein kinase